MTSGGLDQYIIHLSETKLQNYIIKELKLECPTDNRMEVMEVLWEDKWEITRSGPNGSDHTKQLIYAVKNVKL